MLRKFRKRKNIAKRSLLLCLCSLLVFTSVLSGYEMPVHAASLWEKADNWMDAMRTNNALNWLQFSARDALRKGEDFSLDLTDYPLLRSAMNASVSYYSNPTESGTRQHGGGGRSFAYVKNTGKKSPTNQTNYNTTNNYTVFNQNKTWNNTTNNYDYEYNWYNPITNTYNTTNNFEYNAEYNTYHYTQNKTINKYHYTTNYYYQDNRTYVSYYIVNINNETKEEEETYIEHYYELPDGRNSLDLTVDQVKGQYFISNYSKYISVAEDDGKTLGLWHLDGDLKDSSFWNNTAGRSYGNVYTDGVYSSGKQFSDSRDDFLELKLDKATLSDTWTLEWLELVPEAVSVTPNRLDDRDNSKYFHETHESGETGTGTHISGSGSSYQALFYDNCYYNMHDLELSGVFSLGNGKLYGARSNYFVPYALTFDGSSYKFFVNGSLVNEYVFPSDFIVTANDLYDYYNFKGVTLPNVSISVTDNSIKFSSAPCHVKDDKNYIVTGKHDYSCPNGHSNCVNKCHVEYDLYVNPHKNAIVDEVRLSKGVLYTGDSYTPSSQPFTTNTVLAVPSEPKRHEIAFKTNTPISDVRFGGARPTYPTEGYVYVSLDSKDCVETVQQYQQDGWIEIEASVYLDDGWKSLKKFDMRYFTIGTDDGGGDSGGDSGGDTGGDTGGDSGGDSGGDTGEDGGGGVQAIIDGIGKFFDMLLTLVGKLIGMISDFANSVLKLFETLTVFTDGFSKFLTSAFGFLPAEAIAVIISGITLIVILAIIKFLRG